MKYGLLTYLENKRTFNIGDYIQSLAAKQFLPEIDKYINREKLSDYKGEKLKLIMNGWFTHNLKNWLPSENIIPLFISFHMNTSAAPFLLTKDAIQYLKKYEPIGCRDKYTEKILKDKGIKAYFSGCLTLTLDNYKVPNSERTDNIYIVDPLYGYPTLQKAFYNYRSVIRSILSGTIFKLGKRKKHLKKFIDKDLLKSAIYINQEPPANKYNDAEKFELAEELLHKYARAKLVITSRIHCALPCLAMGTPVIFVNAFDDFVDSCRLDGLLDLFNRISLNYETGEQKINFPLKGKINKNTLVNNPENHKILIERMIVNCNAFTEEFN
jgi:hypothetical protein